MKIFQATVLSNVPAFEAAVEAKFSGNYLRISENAWLIAGGGTAREVCAALGMPTEPSQPSPFDAVVVGVSGYFGYGPNNVWEWMFAKQAADA